MLKFSLIRNSAPAHQPKRNQIEKLIRASLQQKYVNVILSLSIVDLVSSQELNLEYRGIDKPTNVISLEYPEAREQFNFLSGELILCDEVIQVEAAAQGKSILEHYAHMIIHGVLHLQGYDHQIDEEAETMELLERQIMHNLGFADPYQDRNEII
jgi:probable rRNA maturation factor